MYLVQALLPTSVDGTSLRPRLLEVRDELTSKFGGVTIFSRAPAEGLWKEDEGDRPERDGIVIFEVMVEELDRSWWEQYRRELETRLEQDEIVVRAQRIQRL